MATSIAAAFGAVALLLQFEFFAPVMRSNRWTQVGLLGLALGTWTVFSPIVMLVAGVAIVRRFRARPSVTNGDNQRQLGDVVELLLLAVGSGASARQSLVEVSAVLDGPVAVPFVRLRQRLDAGSHLTEALSGLRDDLGPESAGLVSALTSSTRLGTALAPALHVVGSELRVRRRRQLEVHARRVPVRLLFPLVFCILPAFALLSVVPLLLSSVASLTA